eukprot:355814-Chlamydomonas_euryale.AAC.2
MVRRADSSTAAMREKVSSVEAERLAALEEAASAVAEVRALGDDHRKLQWQSRLLERMSEVRARWRCGGNRVLGLRRTPCAGAHARSVDALEVCGRATLHTATPIQGMPSVPTCQSNAENNHHTIQQPTATKQHQQATSAGNISNKKYERTHATAYPAALLPQ